MSIFNSLGSNYQFDFVRKSLFAKDDPNNTQRLKNYLENKYQGEAFLLYKGREAIELALKNLDFPKESVVAFNGFTCYAVYKAVTQSGYRPEYIDITDRNLNFSAESLKATIKKNPDIKVLLIQNTLGYPCEIEKIAKICKEEKIILIEDLAHSIGTKYANGKEAGTTGDFTILSFSQDKIIDGISGGALIVKNSKFKIKSFDSKKLDNKKQTIDRLYPLLTFLIRKTYEGGLGKVLHEILKHLRLLSNPMADQEQLSKLPSWYCQLIYTQFLDLGKNISHRKKIATIYANNLDKKNLSEKMCEIINDATNLRFPIFVQNREGLIKYLKKYGIFVADIWYDAPIAPKKYMHVTNYKNQCPQAEKISSCILNLPTHRNITEKQAKEISERINIWQRSQ